MKKYLMPICLVFYIGIIFIVSSIYHSTIFDPMQFLWAFCIFILGPILFIAALVIIVRKCLAKSVRNITLITALLCVILVPLGTFGFIAIRKVCRPIAFSVVADTNTKLAKKEMSINPEGEIFTLQGFHYPLLSIAPARAWHKNEILFIMVPGGPGSKDMIIYDPKEKRDHAMDQHLSGAWWFIPSYYMRGDIFFYDHKEER
jgi:hypothetical protein